MALVDMIDPRALPEENYRELTGEWLATMCAVKGTKEEFLEGLRAALGELEVEIQAAKETLPDRGLRLGAGRSAR